MADRKRRKTKDAKADGASGVARAPDMEAIARRLGVSKTTVHYALRNTGRVSQAMRDRVLNLARELGYRPNRLARSLRTKKTDTLGVILVNLTSSYHAHVLDGIDTVAQGHEFGILVACSHFDVARERRLADLLLEKGVDGLIVEPMAAAEGASYYQKLVDSGVKIVFVDREVPGVQVDAVSTDNERGGYLAGQHLLQLGRKKLAFVTTNSKDRGAASVEARLAGFNRALVEAGEKPAEVVGLKVPDQPTDEGFGCAAVLELLETRRKAFDGLFAAHDGIAYGAMRALAQQGLRVPADIAVIGFDDQDPSAYFQPPLSTVRQPAQSLGEEAVRLLLRRLGDATIPPARQRRLLDPILVVRGSCGAAS
jgi:LacI family transcriptional regulator